MRHALNLCNNINRTSRSIHTRFNICPDHPQCAFIDDVMLSTSMLTTAIRGMQARAWSLLRSPLMQAVLLTDTFWSEAANLKDAVRENTPNYSFLSHPSNAELFANCRKLIFASTSYTALRPDQSRVGASSSAPAQRGVRHSGSSSSHIPSIQPPQFPRAAAATYLSHCDELHRLMFTLIHITSGSPARITEWQPLKLRNTADELRNIYITSGGFVTFLTKYHKSQKLHQGEQKCIARFPDAVTSGIIITYVAIVRPLELLLRTQLHTPSRPSNLSSLLPPPHTPPLSERDQVSAATYNLAAARPVAPAHNLPQQVQFPAHLFVHVAIPATAAILRDWFKSTMSDYNIPINVSMYRHYHVGAAESFIKDCPSLLRVSDDDPCLSDDDCNDGNDDGTGKLDSHTAEPRNTPTNVRRQNTPRRAPGTSHAVDALALQRAHTPSTADRLYAGMMGDPNQLSAQTLSEHKFASLQHHKLFRLIHGPPRPLPNDALTSTSFLTFPSAASKNEGVTPLIDTEPDKQGDQQPQVENEEGAGCGTTPASPHAAAEMAQRSLVDRFNTHDVKISAVESKLDTLIAFLTKNSAKDETPNSPRLSKPPTTNTSRIPPNNDVQAPGNISQAQPTAPPQPVPSQFPLPLAQIHPPSLSKPSTPNRTTPTSDRHLQRVPSPPSHPLPGPAPPSHGNDHSASDEAVSPTQQRPLAADGTRNVGANTTAGATDPRRAPNVVRNINFNNSSDDSEPPLRRKRKTQPTSSLPRRSRSRPTNNAVSNSPTSRGTGQRLARNVHTYSFTPDTDDNAAASNYQITSNQHSADESDSPMPKRRRGLMNINHRQCLDALRTATGRRDAEFRDGAQRNNVYAVVRAKSDHLFIAPTGSGKSLYFLIPALVYPRRVTVVICPLLALQHDTLRRARSAHIDAVTFENRDLHSASLVIVAVEHTLTQDYADYIYQLASEHLLHCIILDEAHLALTAACYREPMAQLHNNIRSNRAQRRAHIPLIALTATCPPALQSKIITFAGLRPDARVSRESGNRPNISYIWLRLMVPRTKFPLYIADRIRFITDEADDNNLTSHKVVVYVPTRRGVEDTCNELSNIARLNNLPFIVHYYHADLDDATRRDTQSSWFTPDNENTHIICTTNAFGCGVDCPTVRAVFHIDVPPTYLDYAQESGRAGRDGHRAYSFVLSNGARNTWRTKNLTYHNPSVPFSSQLQPVADVNEYMPCHPPSQTDTTCRRYQLTSYIDGHPLRMNCRMGDENSFCDACMRLYAQSSQWFKQAPALELIDPAEPDLDHVARYLPDNIVQSQPQLANSAPIPPGTVQRPIVPSTRPHPFHQQNAIPDFTSPLPQRITPPTLTTTPQPPNQTFSANSLSAPSHLDFCSRIQHACPVCTISEGHIVMHQDQNQPQLSCFTGYCFGCGSKSHGVRDCPLRSWGRRNRACCKCNLSNHRGSPMHHAGTFGTRKCPNIPAIQMAVIAWENIAINQSMVLHIPALQDVHDYPQFLKYIINYDMHGTNTTFHTAGLVAVTKYLNTIYLEY